jgi:hypothetical protein
MYLAMTFVRVFAMTLFVFIIITALAYKRFGKLSLIGAFAPKRTNQLTQSEHSLRSELTNRPLLEHSLPSELTNWQFWCIRSRANGLMNFGWSSKASASVRLGFKQASVACNLLFVASGRLNINSTSGRLR